MQKYVKNKKYLAMVKILWLRACHTVVSGLDLEAHAIYNFIICNRKIKIKVIKKC